MLSPDGDRPFTTYTDRYFPAADDMVRYLADFAKPCEAHARYGTRVVELDREAGTGAGIDTGDQAGEAAGTRDVDGAARGDFVATDQHGNTYRARRVIVATGVSRSYLPDIPGIETAEDYATVSVDPRDFTDQRVLIIGKANSALETADNLIAHAAVIHVAGPGSMKLAWKTHYVGHLRAVNNNFLDTYQLKSQNAILDGTVRSIEKRDDGYLVRFAFSRANELVKELRYDRVIACTGFRLDTSIFTDRCRPDLVIKDRFAELSPAYESVNVPDLYFAGTLMQERDFKKSTGGFIHGFRYGVRALYHVLEQRYHGRTWPHHELPATPSEAVEAVVERVNRTSALWQQFGVIADMLTVTPGEPARYYTEVPFEHAHDAAFGDARQVFLITLEYGPDHDKVDPFDITVARVAQDDAERAFDSSYLHPVIRQYERGELVAVHHMAENLENEWNKPDAHVRPLTAFFDEALAARAQV
jgi:thioredoxin reductase